VYSLVCLVNITLDKIATLEEHLLAVKLRRSLVQLYSLSGVYWIGLQAGLKVESASEILGELMGPLSNGRTGTVSEVHLYDLQEELLVSIPR